MKVRNDDELTVTYFMTMILSNSGRKCSRRIATLTSYRHGSISYMTEKCKKLNAIDE